jgi:DNA mismatch repair protein MutL
MRVIRLDPVTSSQIAAGEVVERPASVVRELVENAIDADAKRILVEFEDSGLEFIRVSDDGTGMSAEDAQMAVERFATSKLSSIEDLDALLTLGFRGEALPSIASCSNLTLETREESSPYGTEVAVEGGKVLHVREKGLPTGTTVTVRNLFFNTPARLKFVKSRSRERQAIIDVVQNLALAWADKSFEVRSAGKTIMRTSGQGLRNAVADIFGPETLKSMVPVSFVSGGQEPLEIRGMAGLPGLYRRSRDRQVFAVNARVVRNSLLGWALDEAYRGLLPPKSYPVAFLCITMGGHLVDVNVHPTKAEVRFKNDGEVRHSVSTAVSMALGSSGFRVLKREQSGSNDAPQDRFEAETYRPMRGRDINWSLIGDSVAGRKADSAEALLLREDAGPRHPAGLDLGHDRGSGWEYLGSLRDTYLIAKTADSVILVDKHALMESLAYRELLSRKSGSQELLMAEVLRLSPKEVAAYEEYEAHLASAGFGSRLIGESTALVTKVPLVMGEPVEPTRLRDVLEAMAKGGGKDAPPERLAESARIALAACHASVRAREPLSAGEAKSLLDRLYEQPEAAVCPHGRPTVKEIPVSELDDFFGRTSNKEIGGV